MTLPEDLPGQPPPPLPSDGPGRLFVLCDPARAHAVMSEPGHWSDLLLRLGLIDRPLPGSTGAAVALKLGDVRVEMVQGGAARALLDASLSVSAETTADASFAPSQAMAPQLAGVGSAVISLEQTGGALQRAMETQRLCALAALLAPFIGARHLYWQPASLWSSIDALAQAVTAMEASGLPPILHLIAFGSGPGLEPDSRAYTTRGLAWFSGFEMRVEAPSTMPEQEVIRRAARLAIDSLLNGDPAGPVDLPGLRPGETVSIAPLQWLKGAWWLPVAITGWPHP